MDGREVLAAPCVVCSFCVVSTKVRNVVTALLEILVTSRALLAIPALLVDEDDGRKNGKLLNRQRDMRKIGNGAVPVLEVEGVKKLLRLLLADLAKRLLHGECGSRILGHGVSLDLGVHAMDGKHVDLRPGDCSILFSGRCLGGDWVAHVI